MVHFDNAYINAERRRVRNVKIRNTCKLLALIACVVAIVAYGALA